MPRPGTCSREDPRFRVSLQGRGSLRALDWSGECLTCNGSPPDLLSWSFSGVNAPIQHTLSYILPVCRVFTSLSLFNSYYSCRSLARSFFLSFLVLRYSSTPTFF